MTDKISIRKLWTKYRELVFPATAIVAFIPVFSASFLFIFPREMQPFIDRGFVRQLAIEGAAIVSIVSMILLIHNKLISFDTQIRRLTKNVDESRAVRITRKSVSLIQRLLPLISSFLIAYWYFDLISALFLICAIGFFSFIFAVNLALHDKILNAKHDRTLLIGKMFWIILSRPVRSFPVKELPFFVGAFLFYFASLLGITKAASVAQLQPIGISQTNNEQLFLPLSHSSSGTLFLAQRNTSFFKIIFRQNEEFIFLDSSGRLICSQSLSETCNN